MKAVLMNKYGASETLEYVEDFPVPNVEANNVLVKLKFASVNPVDWKLRDGMMKPFVPSKFPYILGRDGSGVVVQVGENVKNFKEGDEVLGVFSGNGGYAQYVSTPSEDLCIKPKNLPWEVAAAMPLVSETTCQMFLTSKIFAEAFEKKRTGLLPEKRVLIVGASGGTGSLAVLLAKHYFGSYVYAVCGTTNIDYVKSLGADQVIDYKKENFADAIPTLESEQGRPDGPYIDLVLDCAGGADSDAFTLMDRTGTFATIAPAKSEVSFMSVASMVGGFLSSKFKQYTGYGPTYNFVMVKSVGKQLDTLSNWLLDKDLADKINIDKMFQLSDTQVAHKTSEKGKTRGKILLQIPE